MEGRTMKAWRGFAALSTLACMLAFAMPALANAPNPETTKVDQVVVNPDGSRTVTVEGTWTWQTQSNCSTARNGVGYQVDWFDNTANFVGTSSDPSGVLYAGDAQDNIVHSVETLGGSSAIGNAFYDGVPSSYIAHLPNTTPNSTDASNWFSQCDGVNASGVTAGTWGPITHTYAASFTGQLKLCPIMYDPHGGHDNSGQSSVKDITAGGSGRNNDNSYETNQFTGGPGSCPQITIPTITTVASSATAPAAIHDSATLSGSSGNGSITFNLYHAGSGCSGTPLFTSTTPTTGDGTYASGNFSPTTPGSYQWQASFSSSSISGILSNCGDPNEVSTVNKAGPTLTTQAHSATAVGSPISDTATLSGGVSPTGTITWNVYAVADASCSSPLNTQPSSLTASVSGNNSYNSPTFTPSGAGSYKWVATYSGDGNNTMVSNSCTDPAEVSSVGKAGPTLTTDAVAGTVGQPIHDVAHLTGGSSPTGTITWNVYASSDTTCHTPLNTQPSALTATVNGDNDYTSPNFTPSAAGSYQWVATYSGDGNNSSQSTACGDPNEVSTVTNSAAPAITLHKVERIGSSGGFTHGPVTGGVGDTVNYQMFVTNTGNTTLVIAFSDPRCDSGTLSAPSVVSGTFDAATNTLSAGGELQYTCSHVLAAGDQPYTNTAAVVGTPPTGPPVSATDSVQAFANEPGIRVVKLQRDGTSGQFTSSPITASVGDTIFYKIQVTNTGNVPLALSLNDAHCDAGTVQGPVSISGTLNGDTLSAGGVAQYTCSHVATASDKPQFTNTAIVTGTPPSGPPVHGTGIVVANITSSSIQVVKLEKDASGSGGFTRGPITVTEKTGHYVVHTIDYEIQVTNTGSTPLTLSLNDPECDAGTIQGPAVITGTLNGDVLSAGGQAQYTCSHRYVQGDPGSLTNVATVTGTPPNGPSVSGTSRVTVQRKFVSPKTKLCRTPTGRIIHYKGHKKPAACKFHPKPPKHPRGFTG